MDRRKVLIAGAAALAAARLSGALAQTSGKVPVVGYLSAASRNDAFARAFRQGLADLGYVEGRTIVIEERYAGGDSGRFPELIDDLLSRNVAVFITGGAIVTQAVLKRTTRVPIVVIAMADPSQLPATPSGVTGCSALRAAAQTNFAPVPSAICHSLSFASSAGGTGTWCGPRASSFRFMRSRGIVQVPESVTSRRVR